MDTNIITIPSAGAPTCLLAPMTIAAQGTRVSAAPRVKGHGYTAFAFGDVLEGTPAWSPPV